MTFYDGACGSGLLAGPTALGVNGQATFSTAALTVPSHTIFACYNPTGIYLASSGSVKQTVNQASQTITFGALANKTFGDTDFTVSATASSGLAVNFTATGQCSVTTNIVHITDAGSCTITTHQPGDTNYSAATDVPQSFNIAKAGTQTSLVSSGSPSTVGTAVTFMSTVTPLNATATPTGTVYFYDGTALIGSATLSSSGTAMFSTALLSLSGSPHSITAVYNGSTDYSASPASNVVSQAISSRGTTTAVGLSPNSVHAGQGSTATITVTDAGATVVSGVFTPANGLNANRSGHTATLLPSGMVLVAGGTAQGGVVLASTEFYDASLGTFSAAGALNAARSGHTATVLNDGTVLLVGGTSTGASAGALANAEIFDPVAGTFTTLSGTGKSLVTARYGHSATLLSNGKVLFAGGQNSSGTAVNTTELYDPSNAAI